MDDTMKKIAAVYTGAALLAPLSSLLHDMLPDYRIINLLDDSLIGEVARAGGATLAVRRRLLAYYQALSEDGADLILNTCSSIGEVVYEARPFIPVPIVRIDDAMTREAVSRYRRIGVVATLSTTLEPTANLVYRWAKRLDRTPVVVTGLAEGAFASLNAGDTGGHDQGILETARGIAGDCDVILLAQASMARMEEQLAGALGKPVFSSPRRAIEMVRSILAGETGED
ncbi:MAG: aspartate/glutamate racemase family protein [Treponema sp.]|jgi:Asp/Glu/hydantoin racemase|nr:aspartate/glutamate racemase family protein [Treponema sp.]